MKSSKQLRPSGARIILALVLLFSIIGAGLFTTQVFLKQATIAPSNTAAAGTDITVTPYCDLSNNAYFDITWPKGSVAANPSYYVDVSTSTSFPSNSTWRKAIAPLTTTNVSTESGFPPQVSTGGIIVNFSPTLNSTFYLRVTYPGSATISNIVTSTTPRCSSLAPPNYNPALGHLLSCNNGKIDFLLRWNRMQYEFKGYDYQVIVRDGNTNQIIGYRNIDGYLNNTTNLTGLVDAANRPVATPSFGAKIKLSLITYAYERPYNSSIAIYSPTITFPSVCPTPTPLPTTPKATPKPTTKPSGTAVPTATPTPTATDLVVEPVITETPIAEIPSLATSTPTPTQKASSIATIDILIAIFAGIAVAGIVFIIIYLFIRRNNS